ncbi:MAG: Acetoin utilization protein AcuC [Thermoproteota archaeon]|nr:Acetoin utilization protein AcuC [Thermoproteota archaeon]
MVGVSAFIYHPDYLKYQFGPEHPFKPIREKYTLDFLKELGVFGEKMKYYEPEPATEEDLLSVHSREYINFVKKMCKEGHGYLDQGDTPATKGLYEGACSVVGGSILGAKLIMGGQVNHAFNPGGGLHHAKADSASGFCVFNDIAIATRFLQKKYDLRKIAIVDIDGHHGDGTQRIFYKENILKISLQRVGIFPGTGYVKEIGEGAGKGYSVNIPLPGDVDDESYLRAFQEVVPPLIEKYEPEIIINQFGVDGHYQDPLVGLALTTQGYERISKIMHDLAHRFSDGRLLILGGGGYGVNNTAKCWAIMFTTISEALPKESIERYNRLFDRESPVCSNEVRRIVQETIVEVKGKIFPLYGL